MTTTNNYDPSGWWQGAGMEIYHELNTNKFYKIKFNVRMFITEVDEKDKVKLYVNKCNAYHAGWEQYNTIDVQTFDNIFMRIQ